MASSNPQKFYLCVDCGGTKTAATLCSPSGDVVARALGGPSNYSYVGLHAFLSTVSTAVNDALSIALSIPLPPSFSFSPADGLIGAGSYTIEAAWLGVSGVDSAAAIVKLTPDISLLLGVPVGPKLAITNDVYLLGAPLAILSDVKTAVAVIGGTGSIVISFREGNPTEVAKESESGGAPLQGVARVGGWGWILGDEGGGFDVGRTALRYLLKQRDAQSAGAPTPEVPGPLLKSILERFKIGDLLEILGAVHVPDPVVDADTKGPEVGDGVDVYDFRKDVREKRLSALSPLVFKAALEDGDELALTILKDCAGKLAEQIASVLAPPSESNPTIESRRVPAVTSVLSFGGSLVALQSYRSLVLEKLKDQGHVFRHVEVVDDAATAGAKGLVATWAKM